MISGKLDESGRMTELLVFGDLAASFEKDLQRMLHIKDNEALLSFFERVAFSLREELGRQPSTIQDMFPRFTTLIDILARVGETEGSPILRFYLMTVCQLATFIHFAQGRPFPSPEDTYLLGICTGSFAAAAISVSCSVSELISTGVEATRIAFRTALRSFLLRNTLITTVQTRWSAVVLRDTLVGPLLNSFLNNNKALSNRLLRPYISASSPSHVTLSGPPDVLREFLTQNELDSHRLPIESPFHAAHLFGENDIDSVLELFPHAAFQANQPRIPIISGSTGELISAVDFIGLLRNAIRDVLQHVVLWEDVLTACCTTLSRGPSRKCVIYPFYSSAASMLSSYLARETTLEVAVHNIIPVPTQRSTANTGRFDQSKIAIVGYSGRFPEATSNEQLWELLSAGRDVHTTIPKDRFNWETHHDPTGKKRNTSKVKHGCFINEPGLFDTRFFNMSPREADNTDPAQRLAITATYEAMEMAGMVPNRTPSTQQDRIGVFFGVTSDDWRETNSSQNIDTYFIPGGVRAFLPGRISYFFRFSGPSLCIDTACSSSFAAIQSACGYLWRGECDTAIAGGTNVLTNPDIFAGLDRGHFLSSSGNCNTFDDEASGYCRGEAVGAVIIKRLEDAVADKDPIFGVIVGANTNHCGQTDSITRPHEGDQTAVFKRVLRYHDINPHDVSYIEMHGTGTQAGDATEMRSVLSTFLPHQKRSPQQPLYLGSAKANIAHGESASGVSALIKVLLMMKNNEIPPHCGIKTRINRNYPTDLAERNVRIASTRTPWRREDSTNGTRRVFLNNFSAAGGNTAILVEDAPMIKDVQSTAQDQRGDYVITVTAKSAKSLKANIQSLVSLLEANTSISLPSLSYTTTARRLHHGYRVACSGSSIPDMLKELRLRMDLEDIKAIPPPSNLPQLAFVFTGQGTMYTSLARELFDTVSGFREDIVRFDNMAKHQGFPSFISLIDGSATNPDIDVCASHLALVCVQMALSRLWASWNVRPSIVIGHSLGEYAGLVSAEVISAGDAIFLAGTRAELLKRLCTPGTHVMLAIKAAADDVRPLLIDSSCEMACINQPMGTVVGGSKLKVAELATKLESHDSIVLDIPFSFHTAQVDPILEDFEKAARSVQYHPPQAPILSPLLGRVVQAGEVFDADYLVKACRGVVDFQGVLEDARATSIINEHTTWLEIGSHPTCSGMIKGTLGSNATTLTTLRKSISPWRCIASALELMYTQGRNINWNNYHRDFVDCHQVVQLPRYNWDLKNHWIMYKNDFLLTKGEGQGMREEASSHTKLAFRCLSPSVQRVLEESHTATRSTMLAESDIFDNRLIQVLRGHLVNGAALCPSSLYGDVALTVATALVEANTSVKFTGFDVSDVKIDRPLVALPSETSHLFRVSASVEWASQFVSLSIYSVNNLGNKIISHATVNVRLVVDRTQWLAEWNPMAYLINGRIASLERGVNQGNSHKLKRSMVYKLFSSIVDYSSEYQGMQEVILDSEELEATAKVSFQVDSQGFVMNPRWIDSLGHLAGFIMNGNETIQSDKQVFINHGWSHLRFGEIPVQGKVYTTYNKMQLVSGKLYAGDTYVLDDGRIVAVFEKVAFQGVPRSILDNVLSDGKKTAQNGPNGVVDRSIGSARKPKPAVLPLSNPKKPTQEYVRVLEIIAEELGTDLAELKPDSQFAEFGLDSLLSLTVTSRISAECGITLPSTLFTAYSTVGDLQQRLDPQASSSRGTPEETPERTPELTSGSSDGNDASTDSMVSPNDSANFSVIVRQTIAQETGAPVESIGLTTCLADIGVDSLLSLNIADSLSGVLGETVPSSLFLENTTLEEVHAALGKLLGQVIDADMVEIAEPVGDLVSSPPYATSIIFEPAKSKQTSGRILFLLPDGSGSAASYVSLAKFNSSWTICGINCPWRKTPEEMTRAGVTTSQLVAKLVAEVRRRQPCGPYYLGGWSAGGIFALEAVRQLMIAGEVVEKLLLIDSPNPIGLENPPLRMFEFFESAGVFNGGSGKVIPPWLRPHFAAVVHMLDGYEPKPLPNAPPALLIYARDGICKDPSAPKMETRPDDPREMLWLLNNRTDFSADGWAKLLGRDKISVQVLDNVNHFTMMNEGLHMDKMRKWIQRGILDL